MTNFFFEFKKPDFCRFFIFPQFWEQKKFYQKIGLPCTASYGFLALRQNSEKSNDLIPRKHPDG